MATLSNQFRGSLDITFLGQKYSLMKPSFKQNVFAMFARPEDSETISAAQLKADKGEDATAVKDLLTGSLDANLQGGELTEWLQSITVDSLALSLDNSQGATVVLLKVGLTVILADEAGKEGRGLGEWIRVKRIKAEFLRDYKDDPKLNKSIQKALLEYVTETQDEMTMKASAAVILRIGKKVENGEELSAEDIDALKALSGGESAGN